LLAFSKGLRRDSMLSLFEITTTTEEIRDGVVALCAVKLWRAGMGRRSL
jgi:hypothetical protein